MRNMRVSVRFASDLRRHFTDGFADAVSPCP
nr:MAG TPA: hypothetical protein [Caudoviricetes sp.]